MQYCIVAHTLANEWYIHCTRQLLIDLFKFLSQECGLIWLVYELVGNIGKNLDKWGGWEVAQEPRVGVQRLVIEDLVAFESLILIWFPEWGKNDIFSCYEVGILILIFFIV